MGALMSPADQAAMQPETFANPAVAHALGNLATLPQRAIEGSAADLATLGSGEPKQSIAPATDAAMLMMGGAGAFPAEANSLRAGIRTYRNVPDSLMGYRKEGLQKGFDETAYPHIQDVHVVFPDGQNFVDGVKGMNANHALERAYRNWPDALHITPLGTGKP